jgi:hypothetical protein
MESSIVLARIIGPLLIIVSVSILLNVKTYQRMYTEYIKSPALMYLAGTYALLLGLLMIQFHNLWIKGWPVIITILAWLSVTKGVAILLFPNGITRLSKPYTSSRTPLTVNAAVILILGLVLGYVGYVR